MSRLVVAMRLTPVMRLIADAPGAEPWAWLVAVSLALSGCGGSARQSAPEAQAPGSAAPPVGAAPQGGDSGLLQAERDLDDADARLSQGAANAEPGMSDDADFESRGPSPGPATRCSTVCKAYASLLRARRAICRIDGEQGPRCERANFTVERHENTRAACDCPKE